MRSNVEKFSREIHYDPDQSASFSGVNKLYSTIKAQEKLKVSWEKEIHTTHRLMKTQFKRLKVVVPYIDYIYGLCIIG